MEQLTIIVLLLRWHRCAAIPRSLLLDTRYYSHWCSPLLNTESVLLTLATTHCTTQALNPPTSARSEADQVRCCSCVKEDMVQQHWTTQLTISKITTCLQQLKWTKQDIFLLQPVWLRRNRFFLANNTQTCMQDSDTKRQEGNEQTWISKPLRKAWSTCNCIYRLKQVASRT